MVYKNNSNLSVKTPHQTASVRRMFPRRKLIRDLMAGRSDSYGHIDIGHSGGGGYDHLSGEGYGTSGVEGYSGGGVYGHSGGGGYDSGLSHLTGGSGGYGHSGGYEHPISYSHDSYGHGASYGSYGKMDCPGIPIALLLTTLLGIGILGFILFTKITAAGRRKRNANDGCSSLLPLEEILKVVDFGMICFYYLLHISYIYMYLDFLN